MYILGKGCLVEHSCSTGWLNWGYTMRCRVGWKGEGPAWGLGCYGKQFHIMGLYTVIFTWKISGTAKECLVDLHKILQSSSVICYVENCGQLETLNFRDLKWQEVNTNHAIHCEEQSAADVPTGMKCFLTPKKVGFWFQKGSPLKRLKSQGHQE